MAVVEEEGGGSGGRVYLVVVGELGRCEVEVPIILEGRNV